MFQKAGNRRNETKGEDERDGRERKRSDWEKQTAREGGSGKEKETTTVRESEDIRGKDRQKRRRRRKEGEKKE